LCASVSATARAADEPTGARCAQDVDCASGRCLASPDDPQLRYCTETCAGNTCPLGPLGGGNQPMRCAPTDDPMVSLCVYAGDVTPTGVGWPCGAPEDCAGGICTAAGACTRTCVAFGGGDCPLATTCQEDPADASRHVCLPAPPGGGWCGVAAARLARTAAPWRFALVALAAMLLRAWRPRRRRPSAS
jgi:hypothetical protein